MGENSKIQRLMDNLGDVISAWTRNEESSEFALQSLKLYWHFMKAVHCELLLKEPQGAALATASCIRVWEMLHFHSGSLGPFLGLTKAFVVTLLTAMYPKTKDRRCLYQHTGCVGSLGFPRVSLSNRLPMFAEIMDCTNTVSGLPDIFSEVVAYVQNTVLTEELIIESSSVNELKSKVKALLENFLPQCYLVEKVADVTSAAAIHAGAIIIPMNGEATTQMQLYEVLRETIWKYLIFSHVYLPEERRALCNYLTTSVWSQRIVRFSDDSEVTYATIMSSIVQEAAVCASLMPSAAIGAPDNTPVIHPHVLEVLIPKESVSQELQQPQEDLVKAFVPDQIVRKNVSVAYSTAENAQELFENFIPQEIGFSGASTSCRDCDKLTQFCRNVLLSPVIRNGGGGGGLSVRGMNCMLFSRKRKRDDGFYEGPAFLPIASSLSEMLDEKGVVKPLSTLERIATASDLI